MTEQEAAAFIEETKKRGSILGLDNIEKLMEELKDVQDKLKIIHVAGTNGKGSVSAMLSSILTACGYRVGKYSSPAVFDPYEIYQINGENITVEDYCQVMEEIEKAYHRVEEKGIHPTSFEVETAAAFVFFYEKKCDYVVLETGMGGEMDATNLIHAPILSVLTSISMDHMAYLGSTLQAIASVKAGIIKEHCPVVSAVQKKAVRSVLKARAQDKNSHFIEAGAIGIEEMRPGNMRFSYQWKGNKEEAETPLVGLCQKENVALVLAALDELQNQGIEVGPEEIRAGFRKVQHPGRFQVIAENPTIIIDGAHNEDAARKLAETLEICFGEKKVHLIMGVLADKEYGLILDHILPKVDFVYTITPPNDRALKGEILAREVEKRGVAAVYCEVLSEAVRRSRQASQKGDTILVVGSLYYLNNLIKAVENDTKNR